MRPSKGKRHEYTGPAGGLGLVLDADPSFDMEGLIQSALDEQNLGDLDLGPIGPTDALDPESIKLELAELFNTPPLTSASRQTRRSASPSPRPNLLNAASSLEEIPPSPTQVLSGNSKTRRNKKKGKSHRRAVRQEENDAAPDVGYQVRQGTYTKYVKRAECIRTEYDTANIPTASTGYVALPDDGGGVYGLSYLVDKVGFTLVKEAPGKTRAVVDRNDLVVAVIIGRPEGAQATATYDAAFASLQASRGRCTFSKKCSRRGGFGALNVGISFGSGQTMPGNLCHTPKNKKEVERLLALPHFKRIAGFTSKAFVTWAPKLYEYYEGNLEALLSHHPHLRRNFPHSVWAGIALNFGPKTVTAKHRDSANLPFGWCGITALGEYDHIRGGHIVLWELRLVIEFPHGSSILLPSAAITHSNTPIERNELRASVTQFTAGALFCWVEQGFQTKDAYTEGLSEVQKAQLPAKDELRRKLGLSLFSKLKDLRSR